MGKTVKTVLKIAAVAAIAYFAPVLAPQLLAAAGTTTATALATTVTSAAIGAAAGEAVGVGWKAGAFAGGMGGAQSSGLFGGGASATPGVDAVANSPELAAQSAAERGITTAAPAAPAATGAGAGAGAVAPTTTAGVSTATAPATLGARLGAAATQVGNAGLAGLKAVAPQLAASALAGSPGAGLAKAQQEELARAQQANASLTQARLSEANKLIGDAAYYDPDYMGRQAAEAAMIKGGIQATEETRGLTGARLDAERRRFKLGTARNAGTAYQQGFGTGVGARTTTRQAGIQSIPSSYPTTSPADAIAAQNAADARKAATEKGLSELFGRVLKPTT